MSESPDSVLPDTAMATGNDEGMSGERNPASLDSEEREMLEALEHPEGGPAEPAVEDSPEVASAVADDAPLPLAGDRGGPQDDGLTPEFTDE
ncbi:hypothetical protein [Modestobacter marinus]|uniref:hypothetical protein n=1 Tax=Modestobacter marinus TaxID=477641 RepID=UPI001C9847B7|nr:hypothetical protein [Modestobacter marinus]